MQTEVKDMDTSEKLPVQDTNPPMRQERTFQGPEEMSDPTANEVIFNPKHFTVVLWKNGDRKGFYIKDI